MAVVTHQRVVQGESQATEPPPEIIPGTEEGGGLPGAPTFDLEAAKAYFATADPEEVVALLDPFFERATHDHLKKVPAYNNKVKETTDAHDAVTKQKYEEAARDEALTASWDLDFFQKHTAEQILAAQGNDEVARSLTGGQYGAADISQAWLYVNARRQRLGIELAHRGPTEQESAARFVDRIKEGLAANPDTAHLAAEYDSFLEEAQGDPVKLAAIIPKAGLAAERKIMKQEFDALREELLAAAHGQAKEPGSIPGQVSTGGGMTYTQLQETMSPGERQAWRVANPGLYDKIVAEHFGGA